MSTVENYDGLCGIIHLYASSDKQVRCTYELGHHGKHSWANKNVDYHISGCTEDRFYDEKKFIDSVLFHKNKED